MPWKKGERIPTNLIVGFLGSGKTTAIANQLTQRPDGEHWSVFLNEFGKVSIDHALVDSDTQGVAVKELGGGCFCCTMAMAFQPLLAQFIRQSKPDRLIIEPSGISHPAKVVDILRGRNFASAIDLRNIICLIDPKDLDDPRWQTSEVFQDQVQLADIVVINFTDSRDRELIDRCKAWVEHFEPPKQLILETSFGAIDPELLDKNFETIRFPLFTDAHPIPAAANHDQLPVLHEGHAKKRSGEDDLVDHTNPDHPLEKPQPRSPLRFQNSDSKKGSSDFCACGWIFHVEDIFNRKKLVDFLSNVRDTIRLKGVFRCETDWWTINRAKDATDFSTSTSTYRRDSRLEVILDGPNDWEQFETELLGCLKD